MLARVAAIALGALLAGLTGCMEAAMESVGEGGGSLERSKRAVTDGGVDAGQPDAGEPGDWAWFQLSPDDSTSMASAQMLKAGFGFNDGYGYYSFSLHAHEVINYYDPPASLRQEGALAASWTTSHGLFVGVDGDRRPALVSDFEALELLVHLHAPQVAEQERRPWNLHLCVDVSGSMAGDKIQFTREALQLLADAMRPGDKISLTAFSDDAMQLFKTRDFAANEEEIRRQLANLQPCCSTNMIAGLEMAYEEAQAVYTPAAINRVILFSDGMANVGDTDVTSFAALTRINNQEGIYLTGVGVGFDYALERMDALTDAGKGAHVFLPNADEVGVIFGRMARKLVEVSADEVSVEVMLPAGFSLERFSGEEYSTEPTARVPNVVLAAGDDMTLLASFVANDPSYFDYDMILTVRYRPLASGEEEVFEQRLAIADVVGAPGPLMQRTRLINDYALWATAQDLEIDPGALREAIYAFQPQDPGLEELACIIPYLREGSGAEGAVACTPDWPRSYDGPWGEGEMDCSCDYGTCSAMPAVTIHALWALPLLGLLCWIGRRSLKAG
jgi:Ca-activated chloride channel family protein